MDLDLEEVRRKLLTMGARPSRSADAARQAEWARIERMSMEERMLLALELGRRDRALAIQLARHPNVDCASRRKLAADDS